MIDITDLAERPDWVNIVANWHHDEWLRLRIKLVGDKHVEQYEKRVKSLHQHLDGAVIPRTFIAVLDGKPVGSASVVFYQFSRNQAKSPWLTNVFVVPEWRRRGIAVRLINHTCEYALTQGVRKLMLYTHDQEAYYLKRSWQKVRVGHLQRRPVSILEKAL